MPDDNRHPAGSAASVHAHHVTPLASLVWTLVALLVLTALTVYTAKFVHLGENGNLWAAIGIAVIKATFVISIFMGLLWEKGLSRVALFFCLIGAAVFLSLTLIDLGSRGAVHPESATPFQPPGVVLQAKLNNPEVAEGRQLFLSTCASCHGADARGLPGLGKDMTVSEFIASTPDAQLVQFIRRGRDPSDPMNTTGSAMPPRGGNPTLNNEKLKKIVAFIRVIRPYTGNSEGAGEH